VPSDFGLSADVCQVGDLGACGYLAA